MTKKTYDISPLAYKGGGYPIEIKGLYFYQSTLAQMFRSVKARDGERFSVEVSIIPEPDNPYDKYSLSVRWKNHVIGHIPKELAPEYQQIRRIIASGFVPVTQANFYTYKDLDNKRNFNGELLLPPPSIAVPLNDPPHDGFTVLPIGNAIQVTKEINHLDVLLEYVPKEGTGHLLVSLHRFEAGTRTKWECIEIRLDNQRIGELTKASSEKFVNAIRHFDDLGITTLCHAIIKGSSVSAEVALYGAKAHELDEAALNPVDFQPLPRLCPFQLDPQNYEVPNAYPGERKTSTQLPTQPSVKSHSPQFAHIEKVTFTESERQSEQLRRNIENSKHSHPSKSGCATGIVVIILLILIF